MRIPIALPPPATLLQWLRQLPANLWALRQSPMLHYRTHVAIRAVIAIVGGYFLAGASASLFVRFLIWCEVARGDATLSGSMLAFIVHACAAMYCFGCAQTRRAWNFVAVPAAFCAALAWYLTSLAQQGGIAR